MDTQYIDIQNVFDFIEKDGFKKDLFNKLPCVPSLPRVILSYKTKHENMSVKCVTRRHKYKNYKLYDFRKDAITTDGTFHECKMVFSIGAFRNLFIIIMFIDEGTGSLVCKNGTDQAAIYCEKLVYTKRDVKEIAEEFKFDTFVIMFAFALMHVKNIELIDKPISRQVRRRKERKGEPFYKVLSLEPFKKQVRNEARQHGESEMQRALHICRGHFVTYSEERPLFGKYSGTYWKPAHMRGKASQGEVVKDYKIDL